MNTQHEITERSKPLYMAEMIWEDYISSINAGAVILIPCGALEQHGPHLPLKTDAFIAECFAGRVALETNSIVAPTFTYGNKSQALSGGGQIFPGTTSLAPHTLSLMVKDVLREFFRHGAKKILLINGHGENSFPLFEGVDMAIENLGSSDVKVVVSGWWQFVNSDHIEKIFPGDFPGWDLEHAATTETSLMLSFDPNSVRSDRIVDETMGYIPPYTVFPQPVDLVPKSGLMSKAIPASRNIGDKLIAVAMEGFRELISREFSF